MRKNAACPLCKEPAQRAIWGLFPIWLCVKCEAPDSCVPFGWWTPLAMLISSIGIPSFVFLTCPDVRFWYLRGMRQILFQRDEE